MRQYLNERGELCRMWDLVTSSGEVADPASVLGGAAAVNAPE